MWKCPKCGREFKRTRQNHYCGKKAANVDEYIQMQDPEKQPDLHLVRKAIREGMPGAEERISWYMPTYWMWTNIMHFAALDQHVVILVDSRVIKVFAEELKGYKVEKDSIRIPYGEVNPDLITRLARCAWETDFDM